MSDNDKPKEELKIDNEPKCVISVFLNPDGSFEMKSSLVPPMINWVIDLIKVSLFQKEPSKIIPAKGGLVNWARGGFRR